MRQPPETAAASRTFVPVDLDPSDWAQLEPLYQQLVQRPLERPDDLHRWLRDFSELCAVVSEYGSRRNIDKACHTEDEDIEKAYLHWIEKIQPRIKPIYFELQQKFLASPLHTQLPQQPFAILIREWRNEVEIYRKENIPLFTQCTKISSQYDKVCGAMLVDFQGETLTLQQLSRFFEEPDRAVRQQAWEKSARRRLDEREAIDELLDQVVSHRQQIAENAGMVDFRQYVWKWRSRFDYSPQDCLDFGKAIEEVCVPLLNKLQQQRMDSLGLTSLRPWDLQVDPHNRPPLRPFERDKPEQMVQQVTQIFQRMSPALAEDFALLEDGRNLDLISRRGKRGGGFQAALSECGEPFIFMNAAGLHRDVETMLHEAGHAFHFMWAHRAIPLIFIRHAPIEFCEVASMSLELLALDRMDVLYDDPANIARAKRAQFEGIIRILPWIATIDGFQHWLYTHPKHTREQRTQAWLELCSRFEGDSVDWTGYEAEHESLWQRQIHLFHHPFYYVEYGIAQLGALQVWQRFMQDPKQTLNDYRSALGLGGTRTLPELFDAAGIRFDFTRATVEPLMQAIEQELATLPQ